MRTYLLPAALLALSAVDPALAAADDPRAKDAVDLFKSFCVSTDGARDRALAVLGDGNALAARLPSTVAESLLHQPGAVGWTIRSPSNATLMLGYAASGHCEIRVNAADEASVISQYDILAASYPPLKESDTLNPDPRDGAGIRRTTRGFAVRRDSLLAAVVLTTSDKAGGEEQHLITFDVQAK